MEEVAGAGHAEARSCADRSGVRGDGVRDKVDVHFVMEGAGLAGEGGFPVGRGLLVCKDLNAHFLKKAAQRACECLKGVYNPDAPSYGSQKGRQPSLFKGFPHGR